MDRIIVFSNMIFSMSSNTVRHFRQVPLAYPPG
jgi:hypothetical protein